LINNNNKINNNDNEITMNNNNNQLTNEMNDNVGYELMRLSKRIK
jgi:hypothetical protein